MCADVASMDVEPTAWAGPPLGSPGRAVVCAILVRMSDTGITVQPTRSTRRSTATTSG